MKRDEFDRILALEQPELYAELGGELLAYQALPSSKEEQERVGRGWFQSKQQQLQDSVCHNSFVRNRVAQLATDRATVVASIADLIAGICIGVSPFVVSALIVRHGLETFCREFWGP